MAKTTIDVNATSWTELAEGALSLVSVQVQPKAADDIGGSVKFVVATSAPADDDNPDGPMFRLYEKTDFTSLGGSEKLYGKITIPSNTTLSVYVETTA